MVNILAAVVMMVLAPVLVFVVLPEDHLLAAGGVLGHEDMGIPKVVVVASGRLVPLGMVEWALFILDDVARGPWRQGGIALVVLSVDVVLLGHLSGQGVVMR